MTSGSNPGSDTSSWNNSTSPVATSTGSAACGMSEGDRAARAGSPTASQARRARSGAGRASARDSRRPVAVRGSRPRHERIPGCAGHRLGLVRQVGEPVVHRLACLVRRPAGPECTAAARRDRAANRSAAGTSARRSRTSPSGRRTVTCPARNPAQTSSEGTCPGPSRTCVPSGHLQPCLPILRITAVHGWRVQQEFLTFSERAVVRPARTAVPRCAADSLCCRRPAVPAVPDPMPE